MREVARKPLKRGFHEHDRRSLRARRGRRLRDTRRFHRRASQDPCVRRGGRHSCRGARASLRRFVQPAQKLWNSASKHGVFSRRAYGRSASCHGEQLRHEILRFRGHRGRERESQEQCRSHQRYDGAHRLRRRRARTCERQGVPHGFGGGR